MSTRRAFRAIPRDTSKIADYGRGSHYPEVQPGEARKVDWRQRDLRLACCACGLVHRIRFNVRGKWLILRAVRAGRVRPAKENA